MKLFVSHWRSKGSHRPEGRALHGTTLFAVAKTWVLTGSLENFRATREHGFRVIGAKERRRGMAEQIEPGDRIVFYVTEVQAFGGIVRVTGEMYEDREKIWPGKPGKVGPLSVALRDRAGAGARRGRLRAGRRAGRRARARGASGRSSTGTSPSRASCAPSPTPTRSCSSAGSARRRRRRREPGSTSATTRSRRPRRRCRGSAELLAKLRAARDRLGDAEARAALEEAGQTNGGGEPGQVVSEGVPRAARVAAASCASAEIVLRDLDRGLVDFPALRDGREIYLCWEEGEEEIGFWHDPDTGFGGRRPLDDG